MCLSIDIDVHPIQDDYRRTVVYARLATCDILVWKVLKRKSWWQRWSWIAPFRGTKWSFGVEHTSEMYDEKRVYNNYNSAAKYRRNISSTPFIDEGLHAFYTKLPAEEKLAWEMKNGYKLFPAIIPRGATFWVGYGGEIVANRMTVFRSLHKATVNRLITHINRKKIDQHVPVTEY